MKDMRSTSQYTHRETGVVRLFCGCQNRLTPHLNGRCQWCPPKEDTSAELGNSGVIRLDRIGNPIREERV